MEQAIDVQAVDVMTVMTLTGDMLKRVLEQQFDNPPIGRHTVLPVSNGFAYSYRLSATSGQRVDPGSIRVNGRVISPSENVRVAVNNFLAARPSRLVPCSSTVKPPPRLTKVE